MNVLKRILKGFDRAAFIKSVACALVLLCTLSICGFDAKCNVIRNNVLRLHILANSDSNEDQALKLKVRDAVLLVSEEVFKGCRSEQEAVSAAKENINLFLKAAQDEIKNNGYAYSVLVEVKDTWFETRDYDSFSLPAGTYEALRIVIGNGEGKNWWCVMFPSLCLPTTSVESEDFKETLGDDEGDIVAQPQKYKARFKIVEIFERARLKISGLFK